jgi:diadenosine tetraphosphate (Ap4A) HIT family hydrolase
MDCPMCNVPEEFKQLSIRQYTYWHIDLRSNQNYLGWCLIILNRHLEDLMDITKDERDELFEITEKLRNALKDLFQPDMFNYASLGNVTNHVHIQVIPRYSKKVKFNDIEFIDTNFGENYSPYDKSFHLSDTDLLAIKTKIEDTLQYTIQLFKK